MSNYPHSNLKGDLTNGGVIRVEQKFYPLYMDEQYKHAVYKGLQDDFGIALYDAIQRCRHPVVVEINEKRSEYPDLNYERITIIRLEAKLTPVETNHIVMSKLDYDFSDISYGGLNESPKSVSLMDKVRRFFGVK